MIMGEIRDKKVIRVFVKKNAVLSWKWTRVIGRIRCNRCVPTFEKDSDAEISFVEDLHVVEVDQCHGYENKHDWQF